jgi:hypothetical protein
MTSEENHQQELEHQEYLEMNPPKSDTEKLQKPLESHEIEFRVQSIGKTGWCTMLAYKDARCDMKRLDEVYGVDGWQRDYKQVGDLMLCGVSIYDDQKGWVTKWDTGTESNTEAKKGLASDAFKRACFNLGIGRELYGYPHIFLPLLKKEFEVNGAKGKQTWDLKLKQWVWHSEFHDDGSIAFLAAVDEKSRLRFEWRDGVGSKYIDLNKNEKLEPRIDPDELLSQCMQKIDECGSLGELQAHFAGAWKQFKGDELRQEKLKSHYDKIKATFEQEAA